MSHTLKEFEEDLEQVGGGYSENSNDGSDAWCWASYHCLATWKHDDTGDKDAVCFSDFWCALIYNQMR